MQPVAVTNCIEPGEACHGEVRGFWIRGILKAVGPGGRRKAPDPHAGIVKPVRIRAASDGIKEFAVFRITHLVLGDFKRVSHGTVSPDPGSVFVRRIPRGSDGYEGRFALFALLGEQGCG